jgi:drug/metabolite transporter (DMT)-like permease
MKTLSTFGLFYCALIWGATFFVVKDTLASVHPVTLVAFRFLIAAGLLFPIVLVKKAVCRYIKEGFVLACFLSIGFLTQTWGLKYTTASNSGFITGLFVLFVPISLFFLFSRRVSKVQWFICFIAVIGLWILTGGIKGLNIGDLLTLICAPAFALQLVCVDRYVSKKADLLSLAFHQFWMTGLMCLAISWIFGFSFQVASPKGRYFWQYSLRFRLFLSSFGHRKE